MLGSSGSSGAASWKTTFAPAVLDGDDGSVSVADQVDLRVADLQRLVDLDPGRPLLAVGADRVVDGGLEDARRALVGAARLVRGPEVLEVEAEGVEIVGGEEVAGLEVVVLDEGVGEAVALDDQLVALGPVELAPGEGDEHHDQGDVEGEVARLPQIALLGGDGVPGDMRAEPALLQRLQRGLADLLRRGLRAPGRVGGQPGQTLGRAGGRPRSWPTNCPVRGTMQPMSETKRRM